jgi:VWFA-related protein
VAQEKAPASEVPVFEAESSVVLLDVVVRDKKGGLVRDLTASEFEVYEDGEKQDVSAFAVFDNGRERPGPATPEDLEVRENAPSGQKDDEGTAAAGLLSRETSTDDRPARPGVIAFVFDRMTPNGRDIAHKAGQIYVERGHVDGDIVGIFQIDLALRTLQPFTADIEDISAGFERAAMQANTVFASDVRDRAREKVDGAAQTESALMSLTSQASSAEGAALAVQLGFQRMEARMLRSFDRLERGQQGFASTNALLAVINGLRSLPGRKSIVFFSEGLAITSQVLDTFRSVIATANRANVAVYAVDAAGLRTTSTTFETREELSQLAEQRVRQEARGGVGGYEGSLNRGFERSEDMLRHDPHASLGRIAGETGGFLVADTNDASAGFKRIQEEMRFYYLLSYSPTNTDYDGRFRSVSVKVLRPDLRIHSRKGYLALPPDTSVPVRGYEAPAIAELDRHPQPHDFPLHAVALSFPEARRPGRVPVMVRVPTGSLTWVLDEEQGLFQADVSVVARLRSPDGLEVDRLSREYPLSAKVDQIDAARAGNILFFEETDLAPGVYRLETVAYDALGKKASVCSDTVDVPTVTGDGPRLSSLVLVRDVERISPREQEEDNPLHYGETIVYPNMGEPYSKSAAPALGFYFSTYSGRSAAPKEASVELLRGQRVLARDAAALPQPDDTGRIQHAAALPLASLEPGEYTLRITVANGSASQSRQARFVVAE